MKFVFYHHEQHGPFALPQLYAGEAPYGGSVARLRILFWIAGLGHEVVLIGNVENGEMKGVRSISGERNLESLLLGDSADPSLIVLNNPPDEERWQHIQNCKKAGVGIILWAGNPLEWVWINRLHRGDLDRIVCVSQAHREAYRLYPGFLKIESCYSGVDVDLMSGVTAKYLPGETVLFASMPRRTKGFHQMLCCWSKVKQAVPTAILRVCGSAKMHDANADIGQTGILDADLEAEFPQFFKDYPSATERAGIELMGMRTLKAVYGDLKGATVAVVNVNQMGSNETFCRSAVEAQVAGVPVVGAAQGSLPEVVAHGKTGLLVDKKDPLALAEAIVSLLKDKSLRQRMGAAGPEWARPMADYEWIVNDWEGIARRTFSGEPAPANRDPAKDLLRRLGYGRVRLWARKMLKRKRNDKNN